MTLRILRKSHFNSMKWRTCLISPIRKAKWKSNVLDIRMYFSHVDSRWKRVVPTEISLKTQFGTKSWLKCSEQFKNLTTKLTHSSSGELFQCKSFSIVKCCFVDTELNKSKKLFYSPQTRCFLWCVLFTIKWQSIFLCNSLK